MPAIHYLTSFRSSYYPPPSATKGFLIARHTGTMCFYELNIFAWSLNEFIPLAWVPLISGTIKVGSSFKVISTTLHPVLFLPPSRVATPTPGRLSHSTPCTTSEFETGGRHRLGLPPCGRTQRHKYRPPALLCRTCFLFCSVARGWPEICTRYLAALFIYNHPVTAPGHDPPRTRHA